jgi:uncharacterized RmlC-like cupin family protein
MSAKRQPACAVVTGAGAYEGKQGLRYLVGVSAESVGAAGLCMHLVTIPPGASAQPHLHEAHETAIYVLEGEAAMRYGDGLGDCLVVRAGEFLYIPAGVPHQPFNTGGEPCRAVLARTDPNEQESVVLLSDQDLR